MAMIAFTRLGPRAPAIAIARISGGNASGSRRAGTRTAASAPPRAAAMARSATLDPWVEPVIGDVNDEVGDGIDDRGEQRHAEHRRKVEAYRGCGRVPAEARPAEDR